MQWLIANMWMALAAATFLGLLFGFSFRGLLVGSRIRRAQVEREIAKTELTQTKAEVEALYAAQCLICHDKKYFRPVLKRWEGQSLSILYTVMSTSMPESNPGFMSEKEYVDILAYILSLSRYAAGDTELDYQDGALDEVIVEARKRK